MCEVQVGRVSAYKCRKTRLTGHNAHDTAQPSAAIRSLITLVLISALDCLISHKPRTLDVTSLSVSGSQHQQTLQHTCTSVLTGADTAYPYVRSVLAHVTRQDAYC